MKPEAVKELARVNFPSFIRQRDHAIKLEAWHRGRQNEIIGRAGSDDMGGQVWMPTDSTNEYKDLASRAVEPWAGLVVRSLAQTLYVDGVRMPGKDDNLAVWDGAWQANRFDARQIALHQAAIAHGLAFGVSLPGKDPLTGGSMPVRRAHSALTCAAFYDDEDDDEWPTFAMRAWPHDGLFGGLGGWYVRILDETAVHYLTTKGTGNDAGDWTYLSYDEHNIGITPVVRYANSMDLDGRATGEIEGIVPLLRKIDQDSFDRLIVQRFGAWKVRFIAGMAKPEGTQSQQVAEAMRLKVEDLLISTDPNTKFGTLDATDLKGFIEAHDADLRVLSAVTQTPPHHLLGLSSNLQAEALAAAESGLQRKSGDARTILGEAHEQHFRLDAHIMGNREEANATSMEVRWRDTESRSMAQAAAALGQIATTLRVPVEMLWEKIPGWTDADSERAKRLSTTGGVDAILLALGIDPAKGVQEPPGPSGGSDRGVES
jgi:hypothetical protein